LKDAEGGHDWFHITRVYQNALLIAKTENVNTLIVSLAALLHDIADSKFHNGNENIGPDKAALFLDQQNISTEYKTHIIKIIKNIRRHSHLQNQDDYIGVQDDYFGVQDDYSRMKMTISFSFVVVLLQALFLVLYYMLIF